MNSVQMLFEVPAPRPDSQAPAPAGAFATLGRFAVRRRRWVLALFVLGVLAAGILGSRAFAELKAAGYDDPGSESARAQTAVVEKFGAEQPVLALAVEVPAGVDDPVGAAAAVALVGRLAAEEGVSSVISYWTSGRTQQLRGSDGRTGQVLVYAAAADEGQATELGRRVTEAYGTGPGDPAGLRVFVGGPGAVDHAITENITADLTRAESIAMPITLVLLVLVFGGLVAAGLPLVVAAGAIVGSFLVLWLVTQVTDVSVFSLNLITGLGLGLGVDYALLVVNRFREELAAGREVEDAVIRTVATAGRTVAVSGATVAVVLGAMLFYPLYFLRSFGYAGIAVTLLAVLSTIIALPAILAVLGRRVNRLQVRRGDLAPRDVGAWSRLATFVMRRPWPVLLATVGALGALATPSLESCSARSTPARCPSTIRLPGPVPFSPRDSRDGRPARSRSSCQAPPPSRTAFAAMPRRCRCCPGCRG